MRFVAIDLETANPRMSSICQIGAVVFEDGQEVAAEVMLVDPKDYFHGSCVAVHGISKQDVEGAPTFPAIHSWLAELTRGQVVVSHTHFDRVALQQACNKHSLQALTCDWLDSAKVARRAWSQFAQSGYGLANLARHFGISFQHHDALHDARTAGLVLIRAIEESGADLKEWIARCSQKGGSAASLKRDGDGDGPLVGTHQELFRSAFGLTKAARQFPVGLYETHDLKGPVFTGGTSAIDITGTDGETVTVFELKAGSNIMVGALGELLFYASVVRDAAGQQPRFQFGRGTGGRSSMGPDDVRSAKAVRGVLLAEEFHPLLEHPALIPTLNQAAAGQVDRSVPISFEAWRLTGFSEATAPEFEPLPQAA